MKIESLANYLSAIEAQSSLLQQSSLTSTSSDQSTESGLDTYETTMISAASAVPCDTYSDIMEQIKANKIASGESASAPTEEDFETAIEQILASLEEDSDEAESSTSSISASSVSSAGGGGTSEEDQTSVSTETYVGPDGSVFLRTTTTDADGNETVTVTKISDGNKEFGLPPIPGELPEEDSTTSGVAASGVLSDTEV